MRINPIFRAICLFICISGIAITAYIAYEKQNRVVKVNNSIVQASKYLDRFAEFWPIEVGVENPFEAVVFRSQIDGKAWLIEDGVQTPLDSPVFNIPRASLIYAFNEVDGRPTVDTMADWTTFGLLKGQPFLFRLLAAIKPPGSDHDAALLATHEAFHYYFQTAPTWGETSMEDSPVRAETFPSQVKPRILRNALIKRLRNAWLQPENRQKLLQEAKAIYNTYNSEFPLEAARIRRIDILEGTAEYAGYAYLAKALDNWESRQAPGDHALKQLMDLGRHSQLSISADGESYALGLHSGLLLDEKYGADISWKSKAQNTPLVELLLTDVKSGSLPTELLSVQDTANIKGKINSLNTTYGPAIEQTISDWNTGKKDMIAFDESLFTNSYTISAFVQTSDTPENFTLGVNYSTTLIRDGKALDITGHALFPADSYQTSCGNSVVILPITNVNDSVLIGNESFDPLVGGGKLYCIRE